MRRPNRNFWRGRKVLVTGHTGFKGTWLCLMLHQLGAKVAGFALPPEAGPTAFSALRVESFVESSHGDLLDYANVKQVVQDATPDVVLHLAAQAFVSRGYRYPNETFATNVIGTLNLLGALRAASDCRACVAVTSDKVYRNDGSGKPFREGDALGGQDPYSASKAACEIAVASYAASFKGDLPAIATVRAGNVLGGGDFGESRLIPDLVRSEKNGEVLIIRQPDATRPFQHVLDVLVAYLLVAEDLALRPNITPSAINIGPIGPEMLVRDLLSSYGKVRGRDVAWKVADRVTMIEVTHLALDSSLARKQLQWSSRFSSHNMLAKTARWYDAWMRGEDLLALSCADIAELLT
jgi:CDP-glucose 4,6-dehydratase